MSEEQTWKKIIKPQNRLLDLKIKETWQYRDLVMLFVKREFVSKYKQTVLGPAWAIIQPLLTTVVFTVVFGKLAELSTSDLYTESEVVIPSFLFYMVGTIIWGYFSSTVTVTSNTFIGNAAIMGKVYFPRMVTPVSNAIANLISFGIQFVLLIVILITMMVTGNLNIFPSSNLILIPLLILQMIMLSTGVGIIISSMTTKYRDLAMLIGFGLQLWQYASPIAYGVALIPEKYLGIYMLNPVTPIITTMRYALFGVGYFNAFFYFKSWIITAVVFFIGLILFNRIEKSFMDTV